MSKPDIKELFGRRVRQLRTATGISQEAFAHQIKIDRSYYGSIERGERNVSLENISLIAIGLGVNPSDLLRFDKLPDATKTQAEAKRKKNPKTSEQGKKTK